MVSRVWWPNGATADMSRANARALWQKMRVNLGQPFVIAGYTPAGRTFDAIVFGYFDNARVMYAGRTAQWVHAFVP